MFHPRNRLVVAAGEQETFKRPKQWPCEHKEKRVDRSEVTPTESQEPPPAMGIDGMDG